MTMDEKLLKVTWLDAKGANEWITKSELLDKEGITFENVGFGYIKDNGDIVVAAQKCPDDGDYKNWLIVPASYIVSVHRLEEVIDNSPNNM